ncbi:A/G-specific adenine glycosylase [Staphylococcus condimenti]|uniref:Adenine DNA glycosylase n=1 Tax=Staphylococcus condimenti TaxID=70255 RepID=A0A143P7Y3_9STAP|nr:MULTISPECIES: A/G-specific adenine glycosylase [Staphylococcus]AMY04440.1 A/G-specific adenine glycosylase [Staphylococcus condimenti]APR60676.1 A/G-specific adenine glycosylase [Staphylococcus condimenti]MDK8646416.1 A/G-specific adenine glycosylase [Staphylococcus condimenti]OFP03941.1 A/G-specific adenine glycosylase [Staphylococcus sp. HMSC065E08]PNZ56355.1 A/G-specific adenine glycosylase [Staphylococcus condimenti]
MLQPDTFKDDILNWFKINQREMPWRETTNPYYIWISEVMLQQTQVKTVIDYYHRFTERFPTIEDLSMAEQDEVLKYWEGLGYYSRARNFHTAIQEVAESYHGKVPDNPEVFEKLKGVGPYTKAAVMSIAFDLPLPTVDGNVFRVWSRLNNDFSDTAKQSTRKAFENELMPYVETEAGQFNQAMMELGALICTPKSPLCLLCPVQSHCEAFQEGTVEKLPVKIKKVKKKTVHQDCFIIQNEKGEYLIEQRQAKLLNGMWEFPMYEQEESEQKLNALLDENIEVPDKPIFQLKHQFTHLTWNIKVYEIKEEISSDHFTLNSQFRWLKLSERNQFNFPASMHKILDYLEKENNKD